MARQPIIGTYGKFRPTGVDTSGVEVLQRMAGLTSQAQDIAFGIGAERAQKEGRLEGLQSVQQEGGQTKPPELREEGLSIRDKAFNQASILAHRAAIKTDTKNRLDQLERDESLDPEKFELRARAYKEGLLSEMPEELAVLVGQDLDASIVSRKSSLDDAYFKRIERENQAVLSDGLESYTDDILNATRSGNEKQVKILSVELEGMLNQAVKAGSLDPVKARAIRKDLIERGLKEDAIGKIKRELTDEPTIGTINNATELLKKIDKQKFKDLNPQQKDEMINGAKIIINGAMSDLARTNSKNKARLGGDIKQLKSEISRAKTNLNAGVNVNSKELSGLVSRSIDINNQTGEQTIDVAELQREIEEQQEVNTFSARSKFDREGIESSLVSLERSGKLSNEQAEVLRRIRKASKQVNSQLEKKGVEYFEEQGLGSIGDLELINQDGEFDVSLFSESLEFRKKKTLEASEHYAKDLSPFTNFEAEQITRLYSAMDSQGKSGLLGSIVEGLGDMSIPALSQMNDKGAGVMALSGAILNDGGDPTLILQGQDLLKEPANKNLLPTGGEAVASFEREITVQLGTAFAMNPQQRGATVQAVKAAYAALSAQDGVSDEMVDSDRLKKAINVATGGIVEHNEFMISSPIRGMSQGDFEDVIDSLTVKSFEFSDQELPEIDKELLIEQIQDYATFHDVGPGQYLVKIGDGYLVDIDGNEYIFNLRNIIEGKK